VKEYAEARGLTQQVGNEDYWIKPCIYGNSGDRLWVRETWGYPDSNVSPGRDADYVSFRADEQTWWKNCSPPYSGSSCSGYIPPKKWRPSIFMPRWASRITLEIVNIRVERIQSISGQDCFREGIDGKFLAYPEASQEALLELATSQIRDRFMLLWDSINAARGFGWEVNPWVWVIEFHKAAKTPSEPNEAK
jgi:hypothetical protein